MSKIKSVSVGELKRLISSELLPSGMSPSGRKEIFIVPDYQRGYRWDAEIHVRALLEDVLDFMLRSTQKNEIYCIQPLVVTQHPTKKGAWEVIDGQQRLTTLYLILKAFGKDCFDLEYETRQETTGKFLEELTVNSVEDHDNPDFHFISKAWRFIKEWCNDNSLKVPNFESEFLYTLERNVRVIWYDVESCDRNLNIDIFNRLNVGKIPLTESELVKALLLSKIKNIYKGDELTLRQSEISNEFYRMESELRKPHKWGFLNCSGAEQDSHLDLILDLISQENNPGGLTPYLWFEKKIMGGEVATDAAVQGKSAMAFWRQIKQTFATVDSWFCETGRDSAIYHYAGYLLASAIKEVTQLYEMAKGVARKEFERKLHDAIADNLRTDFKGAGILDDDGGFSLKELEYGDDSKRIEKLLLLLNVLACMKITDGQYNRFPFERYIEKEWSIEHIYPQNPAEPMKDRKDIEAWLKATIKGLKDIWRIHDKSKDFEERDGKFASLKEELEKMANSFNGKARSEEKIKEFNKLRRDLLNCFFEKPRHDFSNLALLSRGDNAALNNATFPIKRDLIIELERAGAFIPPCTRNVFLKSYSSSGSQPYFWSESDSDAYLQAMEDLLKNFLKEPTNG